MCLFRGGSGGGGGVLGVRNPPPPLWGTTKLHKEGKNVACMRGKTAHFSYPDPPFLKSCIRLGGLVTGDMGDI